MAPLLWKIFVSAGAALFVRNGRDPNRGRSERFDVIHLLLNALEITAMNPRATCWRERRTVAAFRVVIRWIAVVETVGKDEVDVLVAPVVRRGVVRGACKR